MTTPDQQRTPPRSEFEAAFGEPLEETLDLSKWRLGDDLAATFERLDREVADAVREEDHYRRRIRAEVFAKDTFASIRRTVPNAGKYQASTADVQRVQNGLLFNGAVEACDGISVVHDTLPLTITQIGVCLVSYQGEQGTYSHRLYRRDLRSRIDDPVEEIKALFQEREKREAQGQEGNALSELARRGIMAYAERAILLHRSDAQWRLGHGSPAPYELLTGLWSSEYDRIKRSIDLITGYVDHKRFVYVPSAPRDRHLLTLGNALDPLEYVIVGSLSHDIQHMIDTGGYRGAVRNAMEQFTHDVAPKMVVGLFRVWHGSPPYLFYAHADYADIAAHIVMADSILQEHRGFPMLIDLADTLCKSIFGIDSFFASVQNAYTDVDEPFRYTGERDSRPK